MNKIKILLVPARRYIVTMNLIILFCITAFFYSCSDDTYDKHYDPDPNIVSENNLWEIIEATPELSKFSELLKKHGYDRILSQKQAYTIFAPDNGALENLDTTAMNVKTELLDNHITRYFQPASGLEPQVITTMNSKKTNLINLNGNYFFGSASFLSPAKTIVASNGIVHLLSEYESFFPNIWEYLAKRPDLSLIKEYMYSFDEIVFDPDLSMPGSIVDGQQTYLDSVFVNSNQLIRQLGYVNREDSSYTMIVPNNTAWEKAYNRSKDYYVYYNKDTQRADSLQRANACFALVQDLFFNNLQQLSPKDSLVSTSKNIFYKPQYLFEGTEEITASNGNLFVSGELKIDALDSWHKPIIVEAERTFGRENTLSTPYIWRASNSSLVSNGRYLKLEPTTSTGNPTVTFSIPDVLSSYYDIYCVFVTDLIATPNAVGLKPRKVYFNMSYQDNKGDFITDRFPESGNIQVDPYIMDTMLIASNFKFPTANYGLNEVNSITLKVLSNVSRSETTLFNRDLLIDCILLVPRKQD